jgi:hypothetical protein
VAVRSRPGFNPTRACLFFKLRRRRPQENENPAAEQLFWMVLEVRFPSLILGDGAAYGLPSRPCSLEKVKKLNQLPGRLLDKTQKTPEMVLYPMQVPGLMTGLGGR